VLLLMAAIPTGAAAAGSSAASAKARA
jgi:hypothetical protein